MSRAESRQSAGRGRGGQSRKPAKNDNISGGSCDESTAADTHPTRVPFRQILQQTILIGRHLGFMSSADRRRHLVSVSSDLWNVLGIWLVDVM